MTPLRLQGKRIKLISLGFSKLYSIYEIPDLKRYHHVPGHKALEDEVVVAARRCGIVADKYICTTQFHDPDRTPHIGLHWRIIRGVLANHSKFALIMMRIAKEIMRCVVAGPQNILRSGVAQGGIDQWF